MKAHELAKHLLEQPNYTVIMNGWGSDEGIDVEVVGTQIINEPERKEIHLTHEEVQWGQTPNLERKI